jgi:hypothetical protein
MVPSPPLSFYANTNTLLRRTRQSASGRKFFYLGAEAFATRFVIPTTILPGLDAHQIPNKRDRYMEAHMQQRIRELEALPSTIIDGGLAENPFEKEISIENKENAGRYLQL